MFKIFPLVLFNKLRMIYYPFGMFHMSILYISFKKINGHVYPQFEPHILYLFFATQASKLLHLLHMIELKVVFDSHHLGIRCIFVSI